LDDPSKVLFRYANSAGFLNSGTYEIPKKKVDMMRRYEMSFKEDDFLLTLILESYWDTPNQTPGLEQDSKQLPPILQGYAGLERGWHLLTERHAAKPIEADFQALRTFFPEVKKCPDHICKVVLQLTNLDFRQARNMLMVGPMKEWWVDTDDDGDGMELDDNDDYLSTMGRSHSIRPVTPELTCRDVLNILDDTDETDTVDPLGVLNMNKMNLAFDTNRSCFLIGVILLMPLVITPETCRRPWIASPRRTVETPHAITFSKTTASDKESSSQLETARATKPIPTRNEKLPYNCWNKSIIPG
jgi:hypothetical protein